VTNQEFGPYAGGDGAGGAGGTNGGGGGGGAGGDGNDSPDNGGEGGGGAAAGGDGGTNSGPDGAMVTVADNSGRSGNGQVTISYQQSASTSPLTCTVGSNAQQQRTLTCTVTAADANLHFARVNNLTQGSAFVVSSKQPCSTGGLGGSAHLEFQAPAGNKYKVTVMDCAGNKDVYKIDKDGTVTLTKQHHAGTASLVIALSSGCSFTVTGTGLQPNSIPNWVINGQPQPLGNVASNGTWTSPANLQPGQSLYITAITASDTTITSNTVGCPAG
jgi:hypothetical protein